MENLTDKQLEALNIILQNKEWRADFIKSSLGLVEVHLTCIIDGSRCCETIDENGEVISSIRI